MEPWGQGQALGRCRPHAAPSPCPPSAGTLRGDQEDREQLCARLSLSARLRHSRTAAGQLSGPRAAPFQGLPVVGWHQQVRSWPGGPRAPAAPVQGSRTPRSTRTAFPLRGNSQEVDMLGPEAAVRAMGQRPSMRPAPRRTLIPDPDGVRGLLPLPGAPAAKGGAATDLKGPGRSNYCFPRACGPADDRVRGRTECHYDH